jgi:hypothetical protein
MGVRGELFSTRMACDGRTYFFNVKENRMGDLFLSIVESKPTETDEFDRRSIVVFQDNVEEFIKALRKSVDAMGEADPSVRSAKPPRVRRDAKLPRDDGRDAESRLSDDERPRHYIDTGRPRGVDPRGAEPRGAEPRGAETRGRPGEHRPGEHRPGASAERGPRSGGPRSGGPRSGNPRRDDTRHSAVRRDIDNATGRTASDGRAATIGRDAPASRRPAPTGRVLRVKPKASPAASDTKPPAKAKTPARRMTVRRAKLKDDE